jgi:hypothetical protein
MLLKIAKHRLRKSNHFRHYDHFLTPNERVFYARQSIDGTQKVIDECWMAIRNPKETGDRRMMALQLAFESTKSKIDMLKMVKQLFQDLYPIDADHDYDYGP